jgi:putative adhesin
MNLHRITALAATATVAIMATLAVTGCASTRTVSAQRSLRFGGNRLIIDVGSSDLRLVPGGGPGLSVRRWLSGTAAKPGHSSWTLAGDTLRLSINCTGLVLSCGSRFQVALAPGVSVVVHSGSGAVSVDGLTGPVVIDSDSGSVQVTGTSGPLEISTGSGDITGSAIRSPSVRTRSDQGSADIGFAAAPRLAEISCGSGNATARVPTAGHRYRVHVSSGTGTARSRVPDDSRSASIVRVTSGQGSAEVQPAS